MFVKRNIIRYINECNIKYILDKFVNVLFKIKRIFIF